MAKRSTASNKRSRKTVEKTPAGTRERHSGDAVPVRVAEYVGASLGRLLNQRDRLARQVANLPAVLRRPAKAAKMATARGERTGNRKKHRGKPESAVVPKEALKKLSATAAGRSTRRKRARARSSR